MFTTVILNKQINEQSRIEEKFLKRKDLDGIDDAIKEYKRNLGTPNSTPARPNFFLNLGKELMEKDKISDAIKIFSLDVEINKSVEAQIELNNAQIRLADVLMNVGQRTKAKRALEKVISDEKASQEIKTKAYDKLTILRNP